MIRWSNGAARGLKENESESEGLKSESEVLKSDEVE